MRRGTGGSGGKESDCVLLWDILSKETLLERGKGRGKGRGRGEEERGLSE